MADMQAVAEMKEEVKQIVSDKPAEKAQPPAPKPPQRRQERRPRTSRGDRKPPARAVQKKEEPKPQFNLKLFDKWDTTQIEVRDKGLKPYINLTPILMPKSYGRNYGQMFHKSKMHIVERLAGHINVPGHKGKFHQITSGHRPGKFESAMHIVIRAFEIIEQREKKNPVEVLVRAIEHSAVREEITAYQIGGTIARKAVITSPQRRVDQALRSITQAAFRKSHKNKNAAENALANELIAAAKGDVQASSAVAEKERIEREAGGSR
jgi:small subunit ribosomal protein S7